MGRDGTKGGNNGSIAHLVANASDFDLVAAIDAHVRDMPMHTPLGPFVLITYCIATKAGLI